MDGKMCCLFIALSIIVWMLLYGRYRDGGDVRLRYAFACLLSGATALLLTISGGYALAALWWAPHELSVVSREPGEYSWGRGLQILICVSPVVFVCLCRRLIRLCGAGLVRLRCLSTEQNDAVFQRKKGTAPRQGPRSDFARVLAWPPCLMLLFFGAGCLNVEHVGDFSRFGWWLEFVLVWVVLLPLFAVPFLVSVAGLDRLFSPADSSITAGKGNTPPPKFPRQNP